MTISSAEFAKAFLASNQLMMLPAMPATAFVSWTAQHAFLEKHIVTGHFNPASHVRISWVGDKGPIRVMSDLCSMTSVNGDEGYRTWNLGKILDMLTPGETIYWMMTDNWGAMCMGAVKIGGAA